MYENDSSGKHQLYLAWDDWDFDFDGAIWPKSNEPVDPNLSLGVVLWHPAKQVTRALPSTFADAEEQSSNPTPEKLNNGDSVSLYFTAENSHEAFLDVRQTDYWEVIRADPIFVVFADEEMRSNLLPLEDCIAQQDRSDESSDNDCGNEDEEMPDATWNIMNNLEQALSSNTVGSVPVESKWETPSSPNKTQEDILAMLGVTGLAKPPSNQTMAPATPTSRAQFSRGNTLDPEKSVTETESYPPSKPVLQRSDCSRKRSYQDTDQENEKARPDDDHTKRKRRLHIDAAYR